MKTFLKKNGLLFAFLTALAFACSDDDNETVRVIPFPIDGDLNGKASFKVVYTQSGDTSHFTKTLTLDGGFLYEDTKEPAQLITGDSLLEGRYSFVTEEPIETITVGVVAIFKPFVDKVGGEAMVSSVTVYRDGEKIDEQSFTTLLENGGSSHQLFYDAE